jgi:hypothetical protein
MGLGPTLISRDFDTFEPMAKVHLHLLVEPDDFIATDVEEDVDEPVGRLRVRLSQSIHSDVEPKVEAGDIKRLAPRKLDESVDIIRVEAVPRLVGALLLPLLEILCHVVGGGVLVLRFTPLDRNDEVGPSKHPRCPEVVEAVIYGPDDDGVHWVCHGRQM